MSSTKEPCMAGQPSKFANCASFHRVAAVANPIQVPVVSQVPRYRVPDQGWGSMNMSELEPNISRVLRILWLTVWRGLGGFILLSALVGFTIGVLGVFFLPDIPPDGIVPTASATHPVLTNVCFGVLLAAAHVMAVRMALRKKYRGFRIALVAEN